MTSEADDSDELNPSDKKGTTQWSKRIRKKAKELVRGVELGYVELAEILYDVYDTPVENDPQRGPVFKAWGYESFANYAEHELGLRRRKAEYLRSIGYKLKVDLKDLDPQVKQNLCALGWTKLRVLTRVLNLKNAVDWIAMADRVSYPELEEAVKKYILQKQEKAKQKKDLAAAVNAGMAGNSSDEEEDELPETEEHHWEHFMLKNDQIEPVRQALERAQELSKSEMKSHNLSLICTDFVANNSFHKKGDPGNVTRYLAKMEELLGVKLVAIDPKDTKVVYGLENLQQLAKED